MSTLELDHIPGGKYSAEQMRDGFMALAYTNGSSRNAEKLLEQQGKPIPYGTLQNWKRDHPEKLAAAEKEVSEELWRRGSRRWRRVMDAAANSALAAIERTQEAIEADDPKAAATWSSTAKNATWSGGVATDKVAGIEGRPMVHHDTPDALSILKGLERYSGLVKVNWDVVESEATDVTPEQSQSSLAAHASPSRATHTHGKESSDLAG